MIEFIVPGVAVGKGRPTAAKRRSKGGGTYTAIVTPEKTVLYESTVAVAAGEAMKGRELMLGPVALDLVIVVDTPASYSMKKRKAAQAGEVVPTKKPDTSNVLKAIEDGMNGVVYRDDVQIVQTNMAKRFAREGEAPGVGVRVRELEGCRAC